LTVDELNFTKKEHLVDELAVRWWHSLPKWPPVDYDYSAKLKASNLRRVDLSRWKLEQEEDEHGFKKAFELECYPGVFKDS
jgi:hypothetical protein